MSSESYGGDSERKTTSGRHVPSSSGEECVWWPGGLFQLLRLARLVVAWRGAPYPVVPRENYASDERRWGRRTVNICLRLRPAERDQPTLIPS